MTAKRPFRFGVGLHEPLAGRTFADSARELEDLGYSTIFVPDHFDEGLGPIAAMSVAATVTTRIRVGTLVLACDFRHPAVLARELATIDQLSQGRLEVGLGAGWKRTDYDRSGIGMDPPGARVGRMIEYTAVLKGLFAAGPFSFAGEHYTITELDGTPAPYRPGGPPILIAGGARRVLRFAGSAADIVGVNASIHSGEIDAAAAAASLATRVDAKVGWVREGAGDRFGDLELNAWLAIASVTDRAEELAAELAPFYQADADSVRSSPLTLIGSAEEIADLLRYRREHWGYSYTGIPAAQAREFAHVVAGLTGE